MNKSLYQISQEAMTLVSEIEETGELTPELEQYLTANQTELQNKAQNVANFVRSLEDDTEVLEKEIKRLQAIKKAKEATIDKLKSAIVNAMQIYGIEKLQSPTLTLSIRRSEAVIIACEQSIPEEFTTTKVTVTPDKVRIKAAIKAGKNVRGAGIIENYSLQIK